jgi:hypothetical protein
MKLLNRQDERHIANAVIADPEEHTVMDEAGAVRSVQAANVEMPEDELLALWKPVNLERLARTYWKYLSRVTLGIIRVTYTEHERLVVVIGRPLVLLRFSAPEYDMGDERGIVQWKIQDGLLVSRRNEGYLEIDVRRIEPEREGYVPVAGDLDRALVLRAHAVAHPRARHARVPALAGPAGARGVGGRRVRRGPARPRRRGQRRRHALAGRGGAHAARWRSARSIPADSINAAREDGLAPMAWMKLWMSPGNSRVVTGTPAALSASP